MKTAEEILQDNIFYEPGHEILFEEAISAMKEYAKQVAEQALLGASENAMMYCVDREPEGVDKDSILNTLIQLP